MITEDIHWHHTVDTLVVGSGNGALTAAICCYDMSKHNNSAAADILVIEKSDKFGGTSAISGGGVWVPNNRYAKAQEAEDSFEEAFTYLDNTIPETMVARDMLKAYLLNAPKMVDYLHHHTHVRYVSLGEYPDYFSDLPGAKNGHRSMEPKEIPWSALGKDMDDMRGDGALYMNYKFAVTQKEGKVLIDDKKRRKKIILRLVFKYYTDICWLLKRRGVSRRTTGGAAGIIRLFLSMRDRGIPLWLNTAFKELIVEDGKVIGAIVEKDGQSLNIKARDAVLLAAGGFEHNQAMREKYLPQPTNKEWSAGCKHNTGDAIQAGINIGAAVNLMENAWWCTTKAVPNRPYPFLSIVNKSLPGSIVVNKLGQRFSNESQNYMSFLKETFAQYQLGNPCVPAYMVFDAEFRKRRSVWPWALPDKMIPQAYFDEGVIAKGDTVIELAEKLGVDAKGLSETIQRFNGFVDTGKDLDFHRGDAEYDRYYGDRTYKPNPCLGKLIKAPFYAVRLNPGDFGTQGGLVINEHAQVCDNYRQPISGLYAFGNTSAAVLPTYPGPGSTLGPAMTFAYQAAKHIYHYRD
jgi:3-oxosteroid 1-dehydrogenase